MNIIKNTKKDSEKQNLLQYIKNYYLAHKKKLFSCLIRFF